MMMRPALIAVAVATATVMGGLAQSKDPDAVVAASRKFAAAFQTCNLQDINTIVTEDMQFIHSDGRVQDKAQFVKEVSLCALADLQVEVSKVRMYGDAAIVQGMYRFTTKKGQPGALLISEVFVRRNGSWLFASHQSTLAPRPAP